MECSLEILPKYLDKLHFIPEIVKEIYIAIMPGSDNQDLVTSSKAIVELRKFPIPHISARNIKSKSELGNLLKQLKEVGVDRALLISGSSETSLGPYSSVMDMLNTGLLAKHGISKIDIAGHPEGNPYDTNEDFSLLEKIEWASINNVTVRIVTQWSFDPVAINIWINRMRNLGINNPIHIGIAGPAKMKTLLNYAKICGVKVSLSMLKKQGFNLLKVFTVKNPDYLVDQIKGFDQLHLFPFGGLYEASNWLTKQKYINQDAENMSKPL